ncbi:MAG: hypothetical protein U0X73_02775 [Thermoanaerobaculia bacterium]
MLPTSLPHLLPGPFNFLFRDAEEIRKLFPDAERDLPPPQRIYQEDETATPLLGYPVLAAPELLALDQAVETYLLQEEEMSVAVEQRASFDSSAYSSAWERYRILFTRAVENVTTGSYGRHFPAIFWLYHSLSIARILKDTPKRILRRDSNFGRERGDEIKYKVFQKVLDRVVNLTYDLVNRLSSDTEEVEEQLFPSLVTRMRDNVLIFTEDHVSPNLAELGSYFLGCLRLDGRDFRTRFVALGEWYDAQLRDDDDLRHVVAVAGLDAHGDARLHLNRPGWASFLATRAAYSAEQLLSPRLVQVWESLLVKLKEFELLHGLRRMIYVVQREGDHLVARERASGRFASASASRLSPATRPLDFLAPWVVDPLVSRFGLIYDISDFSETVTLLRRSGALEQDRSFRMMFRFQRKVNRLAAQNRAKLEKYLGDGAFFSSREARQLLLLATQIQRAYREALTRGFPFNKGMRVALNHGQYRLLPIQAGTGGEGERYEFFGHGVVELSRLTTGKSGREIEEIKTLLVTMGYPEATVNRFFAPMTRHNVDLIDKIEESRPFYAYINRNGSLVNEGIVATGEFISRLSDEPGAFDRVFRLADGPRTYVAVKVDATGGSLLVGIRKLGIVHLKGLDRLAAYEIVDATAWGEATLVELKRGNLVEQIEHEFTAALRA